MCWIIGSVHYQCASLGSQCTSRSPPAQESSQAYVKAAPGRHRNRPQVSLAPSNLPSELQLPLPFLKPLRFFQGIDSYGRQDNPRSQGCISATHFAVTLISQYLGVSRAHFCSPPALCYITTDFNLKLSNKSFPAFSSSHVTDACEGDNAHQFRSTSQDLSSRLTMCTTDQDFIHGLNLQIKKLHIAASRPTTRMTMHLENL